CLWIVRRWRGKKSDNDSRAIYGKSMFCRERTLAAVVASAPRLRYSGGMGSLSPPSGPGLHQTPPKTYSQAASLESKVPEDQFSKVVRFAPVADLQGDVASVDLPAELLSDSEPLWSAYIVGHFMGDAPHIGKVHAIVNRIWSFPERPVKIDAQFISPKTVLFRIDNPQLKARVLKKNFWHIADVPIVVREWSPKTASAQPDLTAVPLWVDLKGVPDHLFSQNGLTFFGDTIGRTVKLHPNTERCVRLDVARLLVVMNLEEPLPASISVRGTGETLSVNYPWLPPRCLGCQTWGHTDKNCPKNKKTQRRDGGSEEHDWRGNINELSKSIDIEEPVLEAAKLIEVAKGQAASTAQAEDTQDLLVTWKRMLINLRFAEEAVHENEAWLTIPQNNSPSARRKIGNTSKKSEAELPTSSPSRYQLLSDELEEGEVDETSGESDDDTSGESQAALDQKEQLEKQKSGKNKKAQRNVPSVNVGAKKVQTKRTKNKQNNHASSRRH
ncbi:LOW QUALITY PROTEIN: hypothetical protein HID58_095224, partial [Brassica napus]